MLAFLLLALQSPDVLIVVADDVARADVLEIETPAIDALARSGADFQRGYSMPACSPTRQTLFFGRYINHNAGDARQVGPDTPEFSWYSLPKMFKGAGYSTLLVGKWHVGTNDVAEWTASPHLHGFDAWRSGRAHNTPDYFSWERVDDGVVTTSTTYPTIADRDAFLEWWAETPGPRFAFVSLASAHAPYHVPPPEALPPGWPAPATTRERFEAMVASLDLVLGEIVRAVDPLNTIVLFVGDNGTPRPVSPHGEGKGSALERGVNVPLVMRGPGIRPGARNQLVHVVDFMATLGELLRICPPASLLDLGLDTRSFAPALEDPLWPGRSTVYVDIVPPGPRPRERAAIGPRWKLRRIGFGGGMTETLLDLRTDPEEQAPLDPADHPAIAQVLRNVLDRHE